MKIKDVVELTSVYLNLEDILSLPEFANSINKTVNPVIVADELTTRNKNILTRCVSLVLSEIASDYFPLKTFENIVAMDNELEYTELSKNVLEIIRIEQDNNPINFKIFPTFFKVEKIGKLTIHYNYLPVAYAFEDEIADLAKAVSSRMLAYGVASEFCFISGLNEEALIWEKRFKDSINFVKHKTANIRLSPRKWK